MYISHLVSTFSTPVHFRPSVSLLHTFHFQLVHLPFLCFTFPDLSYPILFFLSLSLTAHWAIVSHFVCLVKTSEYVFSEICPNSQFDFLEPAGGCYHLIPTAYTWSGAQAACNNYYPGSNLVIIQNQAQSSAIVSYLESFTSIRMYIITMSFLHFLRLFFAEFRRSADDS